VTEEGRKLCDLRSAKKTQLPRMPMETFTKAVSGRATSINLSDRLVRCQQRRFLNFDLQTFAKSIAKVLAFFYKIPCVVAKFNRTLYMKLCHFANLFCIPLSMLSNTC
jgi:hypothetical protein